MLAALALAYWFYLDAHAYRVCCDALDYWRMAEAYEAGGWFAEHRAAGLRTYLYPTVLLAVTALADASGIAAAQLLFVVQFAAYVASSGLLARTVFPTRMWMAMALFAMLACNPLVSPYLGVALTDALALACFNLWLAGMIGSFRVARQGNGSVAWFALAAGAAGLACALRPAYVWLVVLTVLMLPWLGGGRARWARVALSLLLPLLAMSPQMAINQRLFERPVPLPVADLAASQVRWGIANLKYATAPKPGSDARMFYANPIAGGDVGDDHDIGWYARHPLRGAITLGAKLVGAFDFDYLPAYVWDRHPVLQWPFRALSLAILVSGMQGLWLHARQGNVQGLAIGPRVFPLLVLIGWGAVTLVTAVELRFTLPMLSLLLPLSLAFAMDLRAQPRAGRLRRLAAFGIGMALATGIARFVADQNVLL